MKAINSLFFKLTNDFELLCNIREVFRQNDFEERAQGLAANSKNELIVNLAEDLLDSYFNEDDSFGATDGGSIFM